MTTSRLVRSFRHPRRAAAALLGALALTIASPATARDASAAAQAPAAAAMPDALRGVIADRLQGSRPDDVGAADWSRAAKLYDDRGHAPLWVQDGALRDRATILVDALASAHEHGLQRTDYAPDALAAALRAAAGGDAAALAEADVLLTAAFSAYAGDMLSGRVEPRRVEPSWHIDANLVDVDSAMRRTLRAERFADALARLAPQEDGYAALVEALADYRRIAASGGWPHLPDGPTLRPGDSTAAVPALRERLRLEGHVPADVAGGARYDAPLVDAVERFQRRHGLAVDGLVGPRTRAALNVPAAERAVQVAANMERYRWLPPQLHDRAIVVNIPAFRLYAYEDGREALSMRVVVGRELADRQTPVFADSMSYVQFGPYWNVPRGIAVEEILPKARRDRGWLARNDYEIVRGWGDDAPAVDPWSLSDAALLSDRYRVRQRPGARNALGRVKFMFPNDFAVYLHDTPAQGLFDERQRAYSHGCVRVADPAALARWVLARREAWDAPRIARTLGDGERVRVNLERKIPVYLIYLTAFAQDGEVAFREDLYDRDAPLRRALGDVAEPDGTAPAVERLRAAARRLG